MNTMNKAARKGKIESDPRPVFSTNRGPLELVGRRLVFGPDRDLSDLIQGAKLISAEAGTYLLEGEFKEGEAKSAETYMLRVWLDSHHGFLPSKFKTYRMATNGTIHREYNATAFKDLGDGIWFPMEGNYTFYSTSSELELPDGLTEKEVVAFSDEQKAELIKRTIFKSEPIGEGTYYYNIEKDSIRVNHKIDSSLFTVDYPKGYSVDNVITGENYIVGGEAARHPDGEPAGLPEKSNWNMIIILTVVVLAILVMLLVLRKR